MGESQNVSGGLCRLSMIKKWHRELTARNERVAMKFADTIDSTPAAVLATEHIPTMKQKKTEVLLEAIGRCLSSKATLASARGWQG